MTEDGAPGLPAIGPAIELVVSRWDRHLGLPGVTGTRVEIGAGEELDRAIIR